MGFFKRKKKVEKKADNKIEYLKAKDLREHFKVTSKQLYEVLGLLTWAIKSGDKGWEATSLGISKGAKDGVYMGVDYIHWDSKIKKDFEFISAINGLKETKKIKKVVESRPIHLKMTNAEIKEESDLYEKFKASKPKKMTAKKKKEKGDKYEEFIANFFREQGYYVWEHGKEKGVEDSNIDLFVKKEKHIYFVQCKDWETWKLDHNKVKATRMDVIDYLEKNPMFKEMINDFSWKVLYVTSKECLTKGAYTYIEKNSDLVECQVIPMTV